MTAHTRLLTAASRIASNRNELPATPWVALRKLFIQERRDWKRPDAPRTGWKRGELAEVLQARSPKERAEEWGDVGYYVAQTWGWLWWLYAAVTPQEVIEKACAKFERRSERKMDNKRGGKRPNAGAKVGGAQGPNVKLITFEVGDHVRIKGVEHTITDVYKTEHGREACAVAGDGSVSKIEVLA
jgi:NTP pyrophosphatase (non-canonical NTP hydrolase)